MRITSQTTAKWDLVLDILVVASICILFCCWAGAETPDKTDLEVPSNPKIEIDSQWKLGDLGLFGFEVDDSGVLRWRDSAGIARKVLLEDDKSTTRELPIVVPSSTARETEWSKYVATKWECELPVQCQTEYRLPEKSRIDILETDLQKDGSVWRTVAWEVERAAKWKESIGQAVYYREMAKADVGGVVLMCDATPASDLAVSRCSECCDDSQLILLCVDISTGRVYSPKGEVPDYKREAFWWGLPENYVSETK